VTDPLAGPASPPDPADLPATRRPPLDSLIDSLRRRPDVEGPDLVAADGADRLLLDLLAADPELLDAARSQPGALVTLDDAHGALTLGAVALGASEPRAWQDSVVAERALDANARDLDLVGTYRRADPEAELVPAAALAGARIVLARLPRSLAALTDLAEAVARHAGPDVVLLAAGMTKHMTLAMNDVLGASFADVHATRGAYKARAIVARAPRPDVTETYPVVQQVADVLPGAALPVWSHGGAFAGARLDLGTRFLLESLEKAWPTMTGVTDVVDLGCGTGILAVRAAVALPGARVVATDQSTAATASARLTADAAGVGPRVLTLRDDAAAALPDASVDLVLCNPPFHVGAAVHTGTARKLFRGAARVLRPGGEIWTVYNSHLAYAAELARLVGQTSQVARNPTFTVTRSRAR
jgi:16S rRNA (guanine1207-N2)-methyltransferase